MGEVFDALQVMNRTMKLGLSGPALLAAEMKFKTEIARQGSQHPDQNIPADPVALAEEYELFVTLKRRPQKQPLSELARMAKEAIVKPVGTGAEKAFHEIDEALKHVGGSKSDKTSS